MRSSTARWAAELPKEKFHALQEHLTPESAAWTKRLSILAALGSALAVPAPCRYGGATPPFAIDGGGERSDRCLRCQGLQDKLLGAIADLDGVIKVQARGDGSPIHSQRFSFRKAFTAVSMGPMFGVDTTSALVKTISQFPQGLSNVQAGSTDLLFCRAQSCLKSGKDPVGAIGVSGAPSSLEDEACAQAAVRQNTGPARSRREERLRPGK